VSSQEGELDLKSCEVALDDGPEWLWRQVHPNFVSGALVSAEAFVGTPDARSEVSTVRSSARTAEQAFVHHTNELGRPSAGSWAVSVDEVKATGSRAIDDARCEGVTTPGHSYVDVRRLGKSDRKLARAMLAARATDRGRQFPTSC
jgi:hypothetical protein